jgi:hypothetical protein
MPRSSLPIALLATLGLAACGGGGGGGSDADKIANAIRSTAGITDASLCDSLFTDQGIQQTYSEDSAAAARKDCQANVKDKPSVKPGDVDVSAVKISGETATAIGAVKGNKGYFKLRKVGGDWRIDGVSEKPGGASTPATTVATSTTATTPAETTPSSSTDPEVIQVEGSVLAWARAGRNGNKLAFCGLESPGLLKRQTGKTGGAAVRACVQGFHKISSFPRPEAIEFSNPSVSGTTAQVTVKAPGKGNRTTLSLVKDGKLWKIDNAH